MPAVRTEPMSFRPFDGHDEYFYVDLAQSAHVNTSEYASEYLPEPSASKPSTSKGHTPTSRNKRSGKSRTAQSPDTPKRRKTCNAFILFRSYAISEKLVTGCKNMSEMSCRVAELWRNMSRDEQAPFYAKAAQEKTMAALGILPEPKPTKRRRTSNANVTKMRPQHHQGTPGSPLGDEPSSICSPSSSESSLSTSDILSPTYPEMALPPQVLQPLFHTGSETNLTCNVSNLFTSEASGMEFNSPWGCASFNGYNIDVPQFSVNELVPVGQHNLDQQHIDMFGLGQLDAMLEQTFFDIFGV